MARTTKKTAAADPPIVIDYTMFTGLTFLAIAYVTRGSWISPFAATIAFVAGVIWSYRAITTNPHLTLRLLASLVLILTSILISFHLATAQGLI